MTTNHAHAEGPEGLRVCASLAAGEGCVLLNLVNLQVNSCEGDFQDGVSSLSLDSESAALAIHRVLSVDAMASESLARGSTVTKRIPLDDFGGASASIPPNADLDEYRSWRPDAGVLVRPILMSAPSTTHLYPYQVEGVEWLRSRSAAILADDMGLGKTLQAITALRDLLRMGQLIDAIVVAPKSLLATWYKEFSVWAPELAVCRLSPNPRHRSGAWKSVLGRFHVYLTHYEHLRELSPPVRAHTFGLIVADEAHRTRRTEARVTQSIRELSSDRWWALTGTPLERDARDFATLLSMVVPTRFAPSDEDLPPETLRSRARPYVLRRRKSEVLSQLPAVTQSVEWLVLTPKQRQAYDLARTEAKRNRNQPGEFLKGFNRLRQICDMEPASHESTKIDRIIEIIESLEDLGEKGVVFSSLLAPLDELERRLGRQRGRRFVRVDGSMSSEERDSALEAFRSDSRVVVLLASSRVASEGLTLTEANHAIFLNEWWNPSSNLQARDRIVRIGQTRPVVVYKFRCEGTIEEAFDVLLDEKAELFAEVVDGLESRVNMRTASVSALADII